MTNIRMLDPRTDPEPAYWADLRGRAGLPACWDYGLLTIAAWCSRFPLLLAVAGPDECPVGVFCASWVGVPGRWRSYVSATGRPRAGLVHVRVPGSMSTPGWWVHPQLSTEDRRDVVRDYLRAMRRELGPGCLGVLWRQVGESDLSVLPGRPRLVRETLPVALLPARWKDVDEWLDSLNRERRKSMRRRGRQFDADPDLRMSIAPATRLDTAQVVALQRLHERKYEHPLWGRMPVPGSYLDALCRREDVLTLAYHDGAGRLLSFNVVMDDPTWPIAGYYAALPANTGGRGHLYFDQYRHLVSWAIGAGKEGVFWGKGNHELKREFGATLVRQFVVASSTW
ncbi:MAG TPA: hypothetical protein VIR27_05505 [Mycobacteriales bacterium]|jgi:hypothetical protein